MLRVGDLQRSVRFYTEVLGMKLLRTTDRPEQKYSLAFVGYDDERRASVLELTYNYGVERYEMGGAFGHIAIGVADVKDACDKVRAWQQALRDRPSVRDAVAPEYRQQLRAFLEKHEAHLLTLAGRN